MDALCAGELQRPDRAAERLPLHHLPHRRRHHDGAAVRLPVRSRPSSTCCASSRARASRSARTGRQTHLAKKGTPTMGGLMILSGVTVSTLLWANLGQLVRLDRAVRDAQLRRHRLLRRLPQGHQDARARGVSGQAAAARRGRSSPASPRCAGHARSAARGFSSSLTVPFFKNVVMPLGVLVRPARHPRDRRRRQRRQPDRRPRRPRHRAGDDRGGHLRAHRLPGRATPTSRATCRSTTCRAPASSPSSAAR